MKSLMKRPSIKTSLIGLFVVTAAIFAGYAWLCHQGLLSAEAMTKEIYTNRMVKLVTTERMGKVFAQVNFLLAEQMLVEDRARSAAIDKELDLRRKELSGLIEGLRPTVVNVRGKEILAKVDKAMAAHGDLVGRLREALARDDRSKEAVAALERELLPIIAAGFSAFDEQVAYNRERADTVYGDARAQYDTSKLLNLTTGGICLLILTLGGFFVVFGIARPITAITASMRRLAGGDTDRVIPYAGRGDEVGAMAAAVEIFRLAAIDNRRLTEEAEAQAREAERERAEMRAAAAADARRKLLEATHALAVGLRNLAAGDLTYRITETVSEDFTALCDDFNKAVLQLADALSAVADSTVAIESGTRELAFSANDLSKRTEQQAASLEETAAALDEITTNVATSTNRADEARQVASQANQRARSSAEVMADAVTAMGRIEESSRQIANIITVIDDIAFQTNLLALNAGVEAARAGEAGKGFAVVAQEVRELAQRSARAAKEIKELINNSATQVESGVRLVSGTGDALKSIENYVVTINSQLNAIALAAREQSTGLSEVNGAINQMDQVTQRNAAMVEETNAASASLAAESERLRELVSRFRLPRAASPAVKDLRYARAG